MYNIIDLREYRKIAYLFYNNSSYNNGIVGDFLFVLDTESSRIYFVLPHTHNYIFKLP